VVVELPTIDKLELRYTKLVDIESLELKSIGPIAVTTVEVGAANVVGEGDCSAVSRMRKSPLFGPPRSGLVSILMLKWHITSVPKSRVMRRLPLGGIVSLYAVFVSLRILMC
jgi:hypothetical protein